jgi:hypothetical protein
MYAANLVLLAALLLTRANRIANSSNPFFTTEFVALLAVAMILTAATTWLAAKWLPFVIAAQSTSRRAIGVIAWLILSYAALIWLPDAVSVLKTYQLPFVLGLTLVNAGIVALALPIREPLPTSTFNTMGFALISLVSFVLILEVTLRVWLGLFGSPNERTMYLASADDVARTQNVYVGEPYVNFGLSPDYPSHTSLGYRGPEIVQPKPAGTFRIVAMGSSSTYGIGLNWQETYPAQLEKLLRERYGYSKVEVINAGVAAYTSWETLVNFEFRVLDLQPDMIISYDWINDVVARLVDPKRYNSMNAERGVWQSDLAPLPFSALYRYVAIDAGWMPNPAFADWQIRTESDVERCTDTTFCANLGLTPQQVLDANPPVYFERNLRNLIALAKANGVQVVLSSWTYYPSPLPGSSDPMITRDYAQQAVAQHNGIVQRLAADNGVPFYDLHRSFPQNASYWLDEMHLSVTGSHEQAAEYAKFLVDNKLIPESAR